MHVEATGKPIRYRLKSGEEVLLRPGVPTTELPDQAARELLAKATGKVRQVKQSCDLTTEPVDTLSPVYWESAGRILGPGKVSYVLKDGGRFYFCLEWQGSYRWIHERLLRSQREFEQQGQPVCNCCGGSNFWRSDHVAAICRRCHPPASPSLVKGENHAGDHGS